MSYFAKQLSGEEKKLFWEAVSQIYVIRDPYRYKDFLDLVARVGLIYTWVINQLLIYSRFPQATILGGMKKFWNKSGRTVKPHEHGIPILFKTFKNTPVDEQGKTIKPEEGEGSLFGESEASGKKKVFQGYKKAYIYDISQTIGKPLPVKDKALPGIDELYLLFKNFVQDNGYDVIEKHLGGPQGDLDARAVWIDENLDAVRKLKTLVHLHFNIVHGRMRILHMTANSEVFDFQAETSAYLMFRWFGLKMPDHAFEHFTRVMRSMESKMFEKAVELSFAYAKNEFRRFMDYAGLGDESESIKTSERQVA